MDTSQAKSTATASERLTIIAALALLEGELQAFIDSADAYLSRLTDDSFYNVPGNNDLGDLFAEIARLRVEAVRVRRKLE